MHRCLQEYHHQRSLNSVFLAIQPRETFLFEHKAKPVSTTQEIFSSAIISYPAKRDLSFAHKAIYLDLYPQNKKYFLPPFSRLPRYRHHHQHQQMNGYLLFLRTHAYSTNRPTTLLLLMVLFYKLNYTRAFVLAFF